jgi:hypothetical protein
LLQCAATALGVIYRIDHVSTVNNFLDDGAEHALSRKKSQWEAGLLTSAFTTSFSSTSAFLAPKQTLALFRVLQPFEGLAHVTRSVKAVPLNAMLALLAEAKNRYTQYAMLTL